MKIGTRNIHVAIGLVLGVLTLFAPFLATYVVTSGNRDISLTVSYLWFVSIPVLAIAGILIQILISLALRKTEFKTIAKGIWLTYPVGFGLAMVVIVLQGIITIATHRSSYADRSTPNLSKGVRSVLFVGENPETGVYSDYCTLACTAALRSKALESFSIPVAKDEFGVFRFRKGPGCVGVKIAKATESLAESGHFNQCIIFSYEKNHRYNVRINYGSEFSRSFGPCCNVAEIIENRTTGEKLVARWEGQKSHASFRGAKFTVSDVLIAVSGKDFSNEIVANRKLAPFSYNTTKEEFARLRSLLQSNAYLHSWDAMEKWIQQVLHTERRRTKTKKFVLSNSDIDFLALFARRAQPKKRSQFLTRLKTFMEPHSYSTLDAASRNASK